MQNIFINIYINCIEISSQQLLVLESILNTFWKEYLNTNSKRVFLVFLFYI